MTINSKIKDGLKWVTFAQVIQQVIKIGLWIILARLILPEGFGLIAIAIACTALPQILIDHGLPNSLVERKKLTKQEISSSYWFNLGIGITLFLIYLFVAEAIGYFFNEPSLVLIIQLLSVIFIISGVGEISNALLKRDLKFDLIVKAQIFGFFCGALVAVILAFFNFGVWSLVFQVLVDNIITYAFYFVLCKNWPIREFDIKSIEKLFDFGIKILLYRVLTYFMQYLDDLIIGYFSGKQQLGNYDRGYKFVHYPMRILSNKMNIVLFPSYVQMRIEEIKESQLKIFTLLSLLLFTFLFGVQLVGDKFVILVLGLNWSNAIPFFKILAFGGVFHALNNINENILFSLGKAGLQLKIGLITRSCIIISYIIGLYWGVIGLAFCYSVASFFSFIFESYFSWKKVNLSFFEFLESIWKGLISSLFAYFLVYLLIRNENITINSFLKEGVIYLGLNIAFLLLLFRQEILNKIKSKSKE